MASRYSIGTFASNEPTSSSSSTTRPTLPTPDPQAWQWYHYYDPARLTSSTAMPGPSIPSIATNPTLDTLLAQCTALRESLGSVQSDVKDALAQLHALSTAQSKTDKGVAELKAVVRTGGRTRRGTRGRGRKGAVPGEAMLELDAYADVPERTLLQSVASIQSAIEVLPARDSRASPLGACLHRVANVSYRTARSISTASDLVALCDSNTRIHNITTACSPKRYVGHLYASPLACRPD